jgi:hypothetical protein
MNSVNLQCILDLLKVHAIEPEYIDCHEIGGNVTYYFSGQNIEKFKSSCVSNEKTTRFLGKFSLQDKIAELHHSKCLCNQ